MNDIQRGLIEIRNASIDELDNVVDVVISAYEEFAEFIPNERWDRYVDNIKDIRTKLEEAEIVVVLTRIFRFTQGFEKKRAHPLP